MSRVFNGSAGSDEFITLAVGNVSTDGGPITVLAYWRPQESHFGGLVGGRASGAGQWAVTCDGGSYFVVGDFSGLAAVTVGEWQIIGYSKADGSAAVRWHYWDSATGWTHTDGTTIGDGSAATSIRIGGGAVDGDRLDGEWVCAGVWNTALLDGAVEAAASPTALQDWHDASPAALWAGDQATTSDPVVDLTGGGADETASLDPATGGADPPGWSYTISSGITGTLAATEGADTLAATGTHTPPSISGTVAVTEADDTLVASGAHTPPSFTGTVSVTEQADTLAAVGAVTTPSFTGTLSATEQADTLVASGTVASSGVVGTLAATEDPDNLAAAGTFVPAPISGTLAVAEADDTLAASGGIGVEPGTLAATAPTATLTATAPGSTLTATAPTADLDATGGT